MLIAQHVLAQVTDSFSDGDFVNAPAWSGNDSKFIVENGELRLMAEAVSGTAFLSTPNQAASDASWELSIRMTFNPSGTNHARVYLLSDSPDLTGALNGYFVLIGDTPDEVSLYQQSGSVKTKIIDGVNGRVNLATVDVRIRATRDAAGNWELFSDVGHTGSFISEGVTNNNVWMNASWSGVMCTHTATRSDDFFFDDFLIEGSPPVDTLPPTIKHLTVVSSNQLELVFSEPLEESTASALNNYLLLPGAKNPQAITLSSSTTVRLSFEEQFVNAQPCILSISDIEDIAGNVMTAVERSFVHFVPVASDSKDVIINEIFPDPEPVNGLPPVEFVELLNRSEKTFDLSGWSLSDGSTTARFSSMYLFPGEHLIVTSVADMSAFPASEKKTGVANFPALNNSEDILVLKDPSGFVIDAVHYFDTWYHDDEKRSGGWTLELIDPENTCGEGDNWTVAEDLKGGTPGKRNSVFASKPDLTSPVMESAIPPDPHSVVITFNEKLANQLPELSQFSITPFNNVAEVTFVDSLLRSIKITLREPLQTRVIYSLELHRVYDCAGNSSQHANAISFGLPEPAGQHDVVINEVLFDPTATGTDFVELYNTSQKFINLKQLMLQDAGGNSKRLSASDRLIAPYQYIVVTLRRDLVIGEYPSSIGSVFYEIPSMPSMNDDEGMISLSSDTLMIDSFSYSDKMHSPFLKDDEGVSLERIAFSAETNSSSNWKSASSAAGFATPGFINSNARSEGAMNGGITIEPESFSPPDSPHDFVLIQYAFDRGGFVANVDVLDSYGRSVAKIANNELLGTSGFFRWDGNDANGNKTRVGYYMVRFEVFDATGVVRVFKKRLAIASRF